MAQNVNLDSIRNNPNNNLETYISRAIPTITANESKGSCRNRFIGSPANKRGKMSEGLRLSETAPLYLNPEFGEMMMGFPKGWSDPADDCPVFDVPTKINWGKKATTFEELFYRDDIPNPLIDAADLRTGNKRGRLRCLGNAVSPALAFIILQIVIRFVFPDYKTPTYDESETPQNQFPA